MPKPSPVSFFGTSSPSTGSKSTSSSTSTSTGWSSKGPTVVRNTRPNYGPRGGKK
jgi:hypothetical protein